MNFDCGEQSLNNYIQNYARNNSKEDISQTHILFDDENKKIISYFSTCNYSVQKESLASKFGVPVKQIPATLIGRLPLIQVIKAKDMGQLLSWKHLVR